MTKYSPCLSHLYTSTYVDLMGSFTVQWLDAAEFGQDLLEIFITDIESIVSGEAPSDEDDDRKDPASMETAASLIRYFCPPQEHFFCTCNTDQPEEFSNAHFRILGSRAYIFNLAVASVSFPKHWSHMPRKQ